MYVDGPNGTRICTEHEREFVPPRACPVCNGTEAKAAARSHIAAMAPELVATLESEIVAFEAICADAKAMSELDTFGDNARVSAQRIRLSARREIRNMRMQIAEASYIARLKAKDPAIVAVVDPRAAYFAESRRGN